MMFRRIFAAGAMALTALCATQAFAEDVRPDATDAWIEALRVARDRGPDRDACGANDGVIDGSFAFHTLHEDNPWWQVDLEKSTALDRVVIYNRVSLWDRAKTITVKLSDDGEAWREVYRHDGKPFYGHNDGKPLEVSLKDQSARYVRLQLREYNAFHLDEVLIYPADDPETNICVGKFSTQSSTCQWSSFVPVPRDEHFVPDTRDLSRAQRIIGQLIDDIGPAAGAMKTQLKALSKAKTPVDDPQWIALYAQAKKHNDAVTAARLALKHFDGEAFRLAVSDLSDTFGDAYPDGHAYLDRLDAFDVDIEELITKLANGDLDACATAHELAALQREALLANPLLNFDKLMLVRRTSNSPGLGLPQNWQGNCALSRSGFDDSIITLSDLRGAVKADTLYKPQTPGFVGDVDLHFDADRMLFSALDEQKRWQVYEMDADGSNLRQVTTGEITETDNYDACYLPDGRIIFASAAVCQGVPCVSGGDAVSNLYLMNDDGTGVRQLCFDQDHNWCPTVLLDGGVLFTRWEYTDTPHYFTRLLFRMNPDGTNQMALYGSNSYWPNSMFYARPIPGHPSKLVTIVSGHHGVRRMGELIILDTAKGDFEADGVVQRIPGRGEKVEPVIVDQLVDNSWPKFLHPWPLSDKYFLVSCKPTPRAEWGVYLADVFDNIIPLHIEKGYALLEPVPMAKRDAPPVIPDRVKPGEKEATIYLANIYEGPGLKGVPKGEVTALRVLEWHYGYNKIGGHQHVALEGGWDVKRILGTVPVEADGSALFKVPANTPLAIMPVNEAGEALQLMRSWFTAMPGEILSCVGCHENNSDAAPNYRSVATTKPPNAIEPWHGPTRGFSFPRDLQPALTRRCAACHNGTERKCGRVLPNFADTSIGWGGFTNSYLALQPYVRRPGPESDYHLLTPGEFRANTSELVQMLRKGHHGVELTAEEWDRLYAWIDFNVPDHGTWYEYTKDRRIDESHRQRVKYRALYANIHDDPEAILAEIANTAPAVEPVMPENKPPCKTSDELACDNWPFTEREARERQRAAARYSRRTVDLGDGVTMDLVLIPAGTFIMGSHAGAMDEKPRAVVTIDAPFWMSTCEISNEQYARFDPAHDSGFNDQRWKDHTRPGYAANLPDQPVIRVSFNEALAFCDWLGEQIGEPCTLPTEAQWEYAARAGSAELFSFGGTDADFSPFANMADAATSRLVVTGVDPSPVKNPDPNMDYLPKDDRFDDGYTLVAPVGSYAPNAWGLYDMHGNVAEWTRSSYTPYPYDPDAPCCGACDVTVRGGSWRDRPKRCTSTYRLPYPRWQKVYNVGVRVIIPAK
jgi:formylglycine-generating enzyme required for sulfatase activity